MSALEVLKAARELISDPARWAQGAFVRDDQICAQEALWRTGNKEDVQFCRVVFRAFDTLFWGWSYRESNLPRFNDTHTHADVLALFDAAIARLESEAHYA